MTQGVSGAVLRPSTTPQREWLLTNQTETASQRQIVNRVQETGRTSDGLMAAGGRITQSAEWLAEDRAAIHPDVCIAIRDDAQIVSIRASKVVDEKIWYRVELRGD